LEKSKLGEIEGHYGEQNVLQWGYFFCLRPVTLMKRFMTKHDDHGNDILRLNLPFTYSLETQQALQEASRRNSVARIAEAGVLVRTKSFAAEHREISRQAEEYIRDE
jgi:hypothetical protein